MSNVVVHTKQAREMENVPFDEIIFDKRLQLRHNTNAKDLTIEEYIAKMKGDEKHGVAPVIFPPIHLFSVTEADEELGVQPGLYLVDGWLRSTAYSELGIKAAPRAEIVGEGAFRDAQLYICSVNVNHGLKRSPEETVDAVKLARSILGKKASLREVARFCGGISHVHVSRIEEKLREKAEGTPPKPPKPHEGNGHEPEEGGETPAQMVDAKGKAIPEENKTLTDAFEARRHLKMAEESRKLMLDELYKAANLIRFPDDRKLIKVVADKLLKEVFDLLKTVTPHTICTKCKGEGCEACQNRGYHTEA